MSTSGIEKLAKYLANQPDLGLGDDTLLGEVAYQRLLDGIRHAGLKPGDPLSENHISRAMGISRTPVREAIRRLTREGLLEIIPNRMITIAAPSLREVLDAVEVREKLEPWLANIVAGNLPPEAQEQLSEIVQIMVKAAEEDERDAWSQADTVYHEILNKHCPNSLLGDVIMQARNRIIRTVYDDYTTRQYMITGTEEHRLIAEAIIDGDSERAERLMQEHLHNVRQNLIRTIR